MKTKHFFQFYQYPLFLFFYFFVFLFLTLLLTSCSTVSGRKSHRGDYAPDFNIDISKIPNAVPKVEPLSKYGNMPSYVVDGHRYDVLKSSAGYDQTGIASWYGMKFYKQRTSSGEPYDVAAMTGASKVLPLPTYVQVTNLKNHKSIIIKINDRGPFHVNRIVDLSYVAAAKLDVLPTGTALVEVKAIDPRHADRTTAPQLSYAPAPPPNIPLPSSLPKACAPGPAMTAQLLSSKPEIYLQLGAFRSDENARNLAAKVKQHTQYPVFIKSGVKNNNSIYRLQIGPIPDVGNTDTLRDNLEKSGLGEAITIIQ